MMLLPKLLVLASGAAAATCPDLAALRTPRVAASFDGARLEGLWFEQAFVDVAQVGSSCQTLDFSYSRASGLLSANFRVTYAGLPFTIVENYSPNRTDRALFVKKAQMPGAGLLTLPTAVVDVSPGRNGSRLYSELIMYSCTTKLGARISELVIATRTPTVDDAALARLEALAVAQGVGMQASQIKRSNHTKCKIPPHPEATAEGAVEAGAAAEEGAASARPPDPPPDLSAGARDDGAEADGTAAPVL